MIHYQRHHTPGYGSEQGLIKTNQGLPILYYKAALDGKKRVDLFLV